MQDTMNKIRKVIGRNPKMMYSTSIVYTHGFKGKQIIINFLYEPAVKTT